MNVLRNVLIVALAIPVLAVAVALSPIREPVAAAVHANASLLPVVVGNTNANPVPVAVTNNVAAPSSITVNNSGSHPVPVSQAPLQPAQIALAIPPDISKLVCATAVIAAGKRFVIQHAAANAAIVSGSHVRYFYIDLPAVDATNPAHTVTGYFDLPATDVGVSNSNEQFIASQSLSLETTPGGSVEMCAVNDSGNAMTGGFSLSGYLVPAS